MTSFRIFQAERVCRRQFQKIDENSKKFSKLVENTVGKGKIARYEQFLLFPQCFQKTSTADTKKAALVWERVNGLQKPLSREKSLKFCHMVRDQTFHL